MRKFRERFKTKVKFDVREEGCGARIDECVDDRLRPTLANPTLAKSDFGQTDFGHPHLTDFGHPYLTDFGQPNWPTLAKPSLIQIGGTVLSGLLLSKKNTTKKTKEEQVS